MSPLTLVPAPGPRPIMCGYCRISFDPQQTMAGVNRQREDIERLAAYLDVDVCWHTADNDTSAWSGEWRADFERMLGHVADPDHPSVGILVYDLDRLCRRVKDIIRVMDLYEANPMLRFHAVGSSPDLSDEGGRAMATIIVVFAQKASADTGRRVARWHLTRARAGLPAGPRGFGWSQADRMRLDAREAPALRQAAFDVMAGARTTEQIAKDWNAEGLTTRPRRRKLPDGSGYGPSKSNPWRSRTVRQALLNPRVGGLVSYHREILLDEETGEPVPSACDPILEPDQWWALHAVLNDPGRGAGVDTRRESSRRYMGASVVRCKGCRHRLTGHWDNRRENYWYVCPGQEGQGCGKTRVDGPGMDAALNGWMEGYLAGVAPVALPDDTPWEREAELTETAGRHAEAMEEYTSGTSPLSRPTQLLALQRLDERFEALRREQGEWLRARAAVTAMAEATDLTRWREAYAEGNVLTCRRMLSSQILEVLVTPKPRKGRRRASEPVFDPERIEIVPRRPA